MECGAKEESEKKIRRKRGRRSSAFSKSQPELKVTTLERAGAVSYCSGGGASDLLIVRKDPAVLIENFCWGGVLCVPVRGWGKRRMTFHTMDIALSFRY